MKMLHYAVANNTSLEGLTKDVQELLNTDEGWSPLGGIACMCETPNEAQREMAETGRILFCQAMIRTVQVETFPQEEKVAKPDSN